MEHPDTEEVEIPLDGEEVPFTPKKRQRRKRGRVPKRGHRLSPSQREGSRFHSINIPEQTWIMLKEMSAFYNKTISQLISEITRPAFKRAYDESRALAIIEARKERQRADDYTHPADRP